MYGDQELNGSICEIVFCDNKKQNIYLYSKFTAKDDKTRTERKKKKQNQMPISMIKSHFVIIKMLFGFVLIRFDLMRRRRRCRRPIMLLF